MGLKNRIPFLLAFLSVLALTACRSETPVDPGADLFGNIFTFEELRDTSLAVTQGTVDVRRGYLSINPVGMYHGYTAQSLIKFTNFSGILADGVTAQDIQQASVIFPVQRHLGAPGQSLSLIAYQFNSPWNEDTALEDIDMADYEPAAMDSVSFPAALDSAETYAFVRIDLDPAVVGTWLDTTSAENQGVLLQGAGDSVVVFGASRDTESPPLLKVSTGDSTYTIIAGMDYGIIQGGDAPEPSNHRLVLQQNIGRRFALSWPQFSHLVPDTNIFIHSARLVLPVDQAQSFAAGGEHQLVIASNSGKTPLAVATTRSHITGTLTASDTALVVESTPDETFLSNYFQGLLHEGGKEQQLVFFYLNDGDGLQYVTFNSGQVRLKLVYSELK